MSYTLFTVLIFLSWFVKIFIAIDGACICVPCSQGLRSNDTDPDCSCCADRGFCNSIDKCVPCDPGTYSDLNANAACKPCKKGQYAGNARSKNCTSCPPGEYQNRTGQALCIPCDKGTNCSKGNCTVCKPCAAGYFANTTSQKECLACPQGSMSNTTGSISCLACGLGTFNDETGLKSCKKCRPGSIANETGMHRCIDCPVGTFTNSEGSVKCENCTPGWFAESPGRSMCFPCRKGTYCTHSGCPDCTPCPKGMDLPLRNSSVNRCRPCLPGTFAPTPGTPNCQFCPTGMYTLDTKSSSCHECPARYYCPSPSQKLPCPTGNACPPGTTEPKQCHGPVWDIEKKSQKCQISNEFLAVILGSVGGVLFIVGVCAFLIWRQVSQGEIQPQPIYDSTAERTPLVDGRRTASVMYTGL